MALDAVENCGIQAYTNTGGDMVMCGVRGKDSPIVHRPGGKVYPQENPDNTDWYDLITCKAFVGSRTAEEVITCSPSTETVELLEWLKKLRRGIIGKMACTTLGLGERLPNLCMCVVKSYKLIISDAESGELYLGDWQSDDSVGYKLVFLQQVVKPAEQGIVNPQNACYFNASMQLLYNIPNIRYELQQYSGSNEVMLRLRELFIGLEGGSSVVATNFWSAMEKCVELPFSYRTQADAQELISHLINYCQEKWTKDMTYLYNGGQFSSIVPKDRAKHLDWMVFQPLGFYALPLSTRGPNTLQKAIEKFGESEQMIGDNKMSMPWRSNTSYETSSIVTKTARIVDPPPFLMIHLKRFKQDGWGRTVKNDTQCEIPEFLDIGRKDAPLDPAKYRLISAICHYGALSGGHYKNYSWNPVESKDSKDPRKKGWIQFNDNARTWMGNYERVKDDIKDRGYMLLFMRTQ
jgi:ubiquitin C-terminal hydrolase